MKRNNIISLALALTQIFQVFVIILMVAFVGVVIHWHFNPGVYEIVDLQDGFKAGFGINGIEINGRSDTDPVIMSTVSHTMLYWLFLRVIIYFIIVMIIIHHIKKILKSIKDIRTFYINNIYHFRRIGYLSLVLFLISCFNFYYDGTNPTISLTVAFTPLFFTVGCFVLAEIFHEGRLLQEDKDQII